MINKYIFCIISFCMLLHPMDEQALIQQLRTLVLEELPEAEIDPETMWSKPFYDVLKDQFNEASEELCVSADGNQTTPTISPLASYIQEVQDGRDLDDIVYDILALFQKGITCKKAGIDVHKQTNGGSPLFFLLAGSNKKLIPELKSQEIDITQPVIDSLTALHIFAAFGNADIVQRLLQHGFDVNLQEQQTKSTPLHYASKMLNDPVVSLLMEHGADPDLKAAGGLKAIDVACSDTTKLLLQSAKSNKMEQKKIIIK